MKSRLLSLAAVVVVLLAGSTALYAQAGGMAASSQFGIGVNTEGLSIQYALSPGLHIGLMATLASQTSDGASATNYGIAPYVRFLLEGTVNPFFEAGLALQRLESGSGLTAVSGTETSIFATFGLEYFITRNAGVFAAAQLLNLQVDPSPTVTTFGYFRPRVGVEWFFNP
jgi:hypothetical protein